MLVSNIESVFQQTLKEDYLCDIKNFLRFQNTASMQIHQLIETEIKNAIKQRPFGNKNDNKNKGYTLKKRNSKEVKQISKLKTQSMAQCNRMKTNSQTLIGAYNKNFSEEKVDLTIQRLPQIFLNKQQNNKQKSYESTPRSNTLKIIQRNTSLNFQKQPLRNSKNTIDILLPNIQEKHLEPTYYTQTLSLEKDICEIQNPKGYLANDPSCYFYFKNNVQNLKKIPQLNKKVLPLLTAKNYCIINTETFEFVVCKSNQSNQSNQTEEVEIASLTKIVTAFLTILICRKYLIDMKLFKCRVSDEASRMSGTSAQLQVGDSLTVHDLLYGLMLPSGNDAAVVLAQNLGKFLQKEKKSVLKTSPLKFFVRQMNILYKQMLLEQNLSDHLFQNPSGLSFNPNITTIKQISIVAAVAMKNIMFREIVSTKEYQLTIKNQRYGLTRKVLWKNTNKLLWKNWQGVKTGTTETAGHCFIGKYKNYLISVFDCATLSKRFSQATLLLKWLSG